MNKNVPVLTDVVAGPDARPADRRPVLSDEALSELQTRIATEGFHLMERLLREAFREMEMNVLTDVISRLRQELPEMVDDVLREHLGLDANEDARPGKVYRRG